MAGVKGVTGRHPRAGSVRLKMWQSMRVLRRFTLPDLCRTSGASVTNARKFVQRLKQHGYVAESGGYVGGRPGEYRTYRIVVDTGPEYETICRRCRRPLGYDCRPDDLQGGAHE